MFKGIFTDSDLLYRINVVNSIDFYAMGFDMMRGETYARNALQWPPQERTDVLIVNVRLEDMSGFELAERIRRQVPQVKVIFLADAPDGADAQAAVRFGAFDYLLKSAGIDALRRAIERAIEELNAEHRESAYTRSARRRDLFSPLWVCSLFCCPTGSLRRSPRTTRCFKWKGVSYESKSQAQPRSGVQAVRVYLLLSDVRLLRHPTDRCHFGIVFQRTGTNLWRLLAAAA